MIRQHIAKCSWGLAVAALFGAAIVEAQDRAAVPLGELKARRYSAWARLPHHLLLLRGRASLAQWIDFGFRQDPNFYYFTGLENGVGGILVLDGARRESWLFAPAKLTGSARRLPPARIRVGDSLRTALALDHVESWNAFDSLIGRRLAADSSLVLLVDDGGEAGWSRGTLAPPPSGTPIDNSFRLWAEALRTKWPHASVSYDTTVMVALRAIKRPYEIGAMRRVAGASATAFLAGLARVRPGRSQRAVQGAVVDACLTAGAAGPSFWPWAMSGPNAVFPRPFDAAGDYHALDRVMRAGELVRLDVGCEVDHYMGDVGRTLPVSGRFDAGQAETWDLLVRAYLAGVRSVRAGVAVRQVFAASFAEVRRLQDSLESSLAIHAAAGILANDGSPYWQLHGVGLEAGEWLPDTLRAGMVVAYEPIFSVDGEGFYLEDMILVTAAGQEVLTKGLPYTTREIERAMASAQASPP